jgi:hypothetical protein
MRQRFSSSRRRRQLMPCHTEGLLILVFTGFAKTPDRIGGASDMDMPLGQSSKPHILRTHGCRR